MSPHEHAEEFIGSYFKLMDGDNDISSFQRILEMKVCNRISFTYFLPCHIPNGRGG